MPRFRGPIWTLLLLAPIIAEVLSGSTRTSILYVLIPEVMVWGVGALLCRELVRRWRGSWVSLLLLGMGLAIAEEFIIQQTSIAPLPFAGAHADYGRVWGVNLVYLLFMLVYESVWVVVVPVGVTELIFPERAGQPWLRMRGAIVACFVFLLGSRIAWFGWTQKARPMLHAAPYHPPAALIAAGLAAIGLLAALAFLLRNGGGQAANGGRGTAPAWLAGLIALVMGAAWFELVGQHFVPHPVQPFWIAIAAGLAWALLALWFFAAWSRRRGWNEVHRWAACFGATLACETVGYVSIGYGPRIDLMGKMIFDACAVTGFVLLGRRVFARRKSAE